MIAPEPDADYGRVMVLVDRLAASERRAERHALSARAHVYESHHQSFPRRSLSAANAREGQYRIAIAHAHAA